MIKLNECKELNYFEHYSILERIEIKQTENIINKYDLGNNSVIELKDNKNNTIIIHPSTKIDGIIQVSYFDNNLNAISDKEYFNIEDVIINEIVNHKVLIISVK